MTTETNDEMTLRDLLYLLWSYRWLILTTTVLGTGLGILYAKSVKPVYEVDALVQLEAKNGKGGAANPLGAMADLFETANPAETEIEVIKSRMVLGRVASKLKLDIISAPKKYGALQRLLKKPKPLLVVERFDVPEYLLGKEFTVHVQDAEHLVLLDEFDNQVLEFAPLQSVNAANNPQHIGIFVLALSAEPGQNFLLVRNGMLETVDAMRKNLVVAEAGKKSGMIDLTYQGFDAVQAANILNEIANTYLTQNVERNSAEAERTLEFLDGQLPAIKVALEESENKLNQYRLRVGSVDLTMESKIALERQVKAQQDLFEIQQKRKEAMQLFKEDHPNVKTLDSMFVSLQTEASVQDQSLRSLPIHQQEVVRLMRDVQVNTELYTTMLNNAQQLRIVKAGEIGNVRVIDSALPDMKPIKPQKAMIVLLAMVVGFLFGAGITALLRSMFRGVEDPKIIEKDFGLPVYAMVRHSEQQTQLAQSVKRGGKGVQILAIKHPHDLALESLRSLRTTLQFGLADAPNRIILITGPAPSIGKSFVAQNAAVIIAQAGYKVLLIDADMRRGKMHTSIGVPRANGLSEILAGTRTLSDNVHTPIAGLSFSFLSSGAIPPNPSELLMSTRAADLMKQVSHQYEYVLVDAPPVLAVTDATILGRYAGASLVVLKAGAHEAREIGAMLDRMKHAGVQAKGAVINDMTRSSNKSYGYEYGYGSEPS